MALIIPLYRERIINISEVFAKLLRYVLQAKLQRGSVPIFRNAK